MTEKEITRMNIWNAMTAQKIFQIFPRKQALAIMLSWSDDDFQMLVLEDTSQSGSANVEAGASPRTGAAAPTDVLG